jgi:ubiquitin carboxyl-terminal hydrolase 4/11/15
VPCSCLIFKNQTKRYKPQFAGNEQQDSQEFLTVMLDSLHEDLNRVVHKPYVQVRSPFWKGGAI